MFAASDAQMVAKTLAQRFQTSPEQSLVLADVSRIRLEQSASAFLDKVPADAQLLVFLDAQAYSDAMETGTDLIEEDGTVVGVCATTPEGPVEVRAGLTVGADGRHSTVRRCAGLKRDDLGAPIDVLWMRLSRPPRPAGWVRASP